MHGLEILNAILNVPSPHWIVVGQRYPEDSEGVALEGGLENILESLFLVTSSRDTA